VAGADATPARPATQLINDSSVRIRYSLWWWSGE